MMGEDEEGTLTNLKVCRAIVDAIITEHHGRIFGSAGDSVLAEFASAVSAVLCAVDCQRAIADRNTQEGDKPMRFRIGVNIGECIIEGDNLYGDGVNVAARLEAIAQPGSVCVSYKVYEEVRRKLSDLSFIDGGMQKLKNIVDPVGAYHIAFGTADVTPAPANTVRLGLVPDKPLIAVEVIRVNSNDEEVKALAEGLRDDISGALARNTALAVKSADSGSSDFLLKCSVQSAGKKLRLSFFLEESASATKVWAERFDRQLDDVFGLQDEIVMYVTSAIRSRVKAHLFERLRSADDATLAVSQLLDKAAGMFHVSSLDRSGQAVATLRLAVEREPENSMAWGMLGFALFRTADYDAAAINPQTSEEILTSVDRAVALDPRSYVARTFKALALQDLRGDSHSAHQLASEALVRNANFVPAQAILGISEIHLGSVDAGLRRLQKAMDAGAEDASHLRWRRELAIGHWLMGNVDESMRVAVNLCQDAPDIMRNVLVLAGLLVAVGGLDEARRRIAALRIVVPDLTLTTARLPRISDSAGFERFYDLLRQTGL